MEDEELLSPAARMKQGTRSVLNAVLTRVFAYGGVPTGLVASLWVADKLAKSAPSISWMATPVLLVLLVASCVLPIAVGRRANRALKRRIRQQTRAALRAERERQLPAATPEGAPVAIPASRPPDQLTR